MIDRLVRRAEVISLKGGSYRLRGRDLDRVPPANTGECTNQLTDRGSSCIGHGSSARPSIT